MERPGGCGSPEEAGSREGFLEEVKVNWAQAGQKRRGVYSREVAACARTWTVKGDADRASFGAGGRDGREEAWRTMVFESVGEESQEEAWGRSQLSGRSCHFECSLVAVWVMMDGGGEGRGARIVLSR